MDQLLGARNNQKQIKLHNTYHSKSELFSLVLYDVWKLLKIFICKIKISLFSFLSFSSLVIIHSEQVFGLIYGPLIEGRCIHISKFSFSLLLFHQTASSPPHTQLSHLKNITQCGRLWNHSFWVRHIKTRLAVPQLLMDDNCLCFKKNRTKINM